MNCEKVISSALGDISGDILSGYERIGRYWDKDVEIDILATDDKGKNALLGEVKWTRNPVGIRTLYAFVKNLTVKTSPHSSH